MDHFLNHHQRVSRLIDSLGLVGYGAYWILNELILSSPEKSMSKPELKRASGGRIRTELMDILLGDSEHFYQIDGKYFSELGRKKDLTTDAAYNSLNKAGLTGRGFSRIVQIHGVTEKFMMDEFDKWKKSRELEVFKDDRHIFNSFNRWMTLCEKPANVQKQERDWNKFL